jgi:hypothetical protein
VAKHVLQNGKLKLKKVDVDPQKHPLGKRQMFASQTVRKPGFCPELCVAGNRCDSAKLNDGVHAFQCCGTRQPPTPLYYKHAYASGFMEYYIEETIMMYAKIMNLDDEEIKKLKIHMVDLPTGTSSSIAALQEVKEKLRFEAFCYTADKNHFHPVPGGVVLPDLQVNVRNINYSQLLRYVAIKAEFVADIVFVVEGVSCSTWSNMNVINGTTSIPVMTDMSRQIEMRTMNNHLKMADVKRVS